MARKNTTKRYPDPPSSSGVASAFVAPDSNPVCSILHYNYSTAEPLGSNFQKVILIRQARSLPSGIPIRHVVPGLHPDKVAVPIPVVLRISGFSRWVVCYSIARLCLLAMGQVHG